MRGSDGRNRRGTKRQGVSMIVQLYNLTRDEINDCVDMYEQTTGQFFLETHVPEQAIWIAAWEQAKEYFKNSAPSGSDDQNR